jgi:histidinol phosphatase-like enzyme
MHERMCDVLADAEATIDRVYYCPHEKEPPCRCRKPAPGMLLGAAGARVDLADSQIAVEAGRNVGCRTAQLVTNDQTEGNSADVAALCVPDVIHQILKLEKNTAAETVLHQHDDAGPGTVSSARLVKW